MDYELKLITAPSTTDFKADAKEHLRVTSTAEDTYITELCKIAIEIAENRTGRKLLTQTWEMYMPEFPSKDDYIEIKLPPLSSVTSVKYYDEDNTLQTLSSGNYEVNTIADVGRVRLKQDQAWPSTYVKDNSVVIKFVCGYGTAFTSIPHSIYAAMKLTVSHFFENREAVQTIGSVQEIPLPRAIELLFNMYSVREQF